MAKTMLREIYQSEYQPNTHVSQHHQRSKCDIVKAFVLLLLLSSIVLLSGCFHDDDDDGGGGLSNADPAGYYNEMGSAVVKQEDDMTDLNIEDLQALVHGNQIKMMSIAEALLYDVTITSINQNTFSGDVTIYRDGIQLSEAIVSGMITEGSSITGTLTGEGAGNGTFNLVYAQTNSSAASLSTIDVNAVSSWVGPPGTLINSMEFTVASDGAISPVDPAVGTIFSGCEPSGDISVISGTSLFSVNITLSNCTDVAVDGDYTGIAANQSGTVLATIVSKGTYSIYSEFIDFNTL